MSVLYKQHSLFVIILTILFICIATTEGKTKKLLIKEQQAAVVLDPGHGGNDTGAKGPGGTLEKVVTLTLARMIADELGNKYRVFLTRTDDYSLDLNDRAAVSNNIKADLFVSLHTGGSFLHEARGMSIFYFKEISKPAFIPEAPAKKFFESDKTNTNWDNIQNKYTKESKVLAKLVQDRLLQQLKPKKSKIQGVPLIVLKGAEMPAILIEIGYLTNPVEEKELNDIKVLSDLAKGISNGINNFFQEKL